MDRTLISWNVPNLVTIWLMLAIGFLALTLVLQWIPGLAGGSNNQANNAGGY